MKQTGVCPKCNSSRIGHLENVVHRTEAVVNAVPVIGHASAPLGVERTESGGPIKFIKEGPAGKLEAYLCGSCGFYETYVKDPASIDYDKIVGFRWNA